MSIVFTHAKMKADVFTDTHLDELTITLTATQKEDKMPGVAFGRELEPTYEKAWDRVNNPPRLNIYIPPVVGFAKLEKRENTPLYDYSIIVYYNTAYDGKDGGVKATLEAEKENGKFYAKDYSALLTQLDFTKNDTVEGNAKIRVLTYVRHGLQWLFSKRGTDSAKRSTEWDVKELINKVGAVTGFYIASQSDKQIVIKRQSSKLWIKLYEDKAYSRLVKQEEFVAYNVSGKNYIANVHDVCEYLGISVSRDIGAMQKMTYKGMGKNGENVPVQSAPPTNIEKFTVRNFIDSIPKKGLEVIWKPGDDPYQPVVKGLTDEGAVAARTPDKADAYVKDITKFTNCTYTWSSASNSATVYCNGNARIFGESQNNAYLENGNSIVYTKDYFLFASQNMTKWNAIDDHLYDAYIGKGYRETTMTLYDYKASNHTYYRYAFSTIRLDNDIEGLRAAGELQKQQSNAGSLTAAGIGTLISLSGYAIPAVGHVSFWGGIGFTALTVFRDYSFDIEEGDTFTVAEITMYDEYIGNTKVDIYINCRNIQGNIKVEDHLPM